MDDIKLLQTCENCGDNLTLTEGTNWAVKRCLNCGGHPVEEVVKICEE